MDSLRDRSQVSQLVLVVHEAKLLANWIFFSKIDRNQLGVIQVESMD